MSIDTNFKTTFNKHGFVTQAARDVSGITNRFTSKTGIANWKAFSESKFFEGKNNYLTLRCAMSVPEKIISIDIKEEGTKSKIVLDFSDHNKTHKILISGNIRGELISATFDSESNTNTGDTFSFKAILEQSTLEKLSIYLPIFEDAKTKLDFKLNKTNRRRPPSGEEEGIGSEVGKAACWGFAGLGAAAVCAGGFGLGCILGSFLLSAGASVCSSQY